jgi:UDP-glucose 4-epimerase
LRSLVTGGAGFIGSHLVSALLDLGHEVCVLDNFSTGRLQNVNHLIDNPRLTVHEVDIGSGGDLSRFFEGVDRAYHLAALADIVPSIENPHSYHRANVEGTFQVLQAAKGAGVKRFVYIASSSCYGLSDVSPTPEDADIRPMYPYALTKYIGETYAMHWAKLYGFPAVSLRLFNVYGPRSRTSGTYGAVFGVFLAQKLAGKPFTVVGDGTQTRDFTFVSDIVDAILAAADSDLVGEIMNVGSGGTYSINRLVELLGGDITYIPKRPGEPDCTFADTTKIHNLLNWKPKVSFEDGVNEMIDNIDYWRKAPLWDPKSIACATSDWFKYLKD